MEVVCKERISIRRYAAGLILLISGMFLVGVCSAKMLGDSIAKDGSVDVAEWSVDMSAVGDSDITLDAGNGTETYSLTVTNNSKVSSVYGIKISNIPNGVKIGLDGGSLLTPTDGVLIFSGTGGDLGYTAPNNTRTHILTLSAESTANITQDDVDLSIEVVFTQKDPRQ